MAQESGHAHKGNRRGTQAELRRNENGNESFGSISDESQQSLALPDDSSDIGRADITATRLSNVDACKKSQDITRRDGAQQITE